MCKGSNHSEAPVGTLKLLFRRPYDRLRREIWITLCMGKHTDTTVGGGRKGEPPRCRGNPQDASIEISFIYSI